MKKKKEEKKQKQKITPSQDSSDSLLINKETIKKLEEEEETKEKIGAEKSAADKTKKSRGRPPKKPIIPEDLLNFKSKTFLKFIFGFCEKKWGDHWHLSEEEADDWGESTDRMLEIYGDKLIKWWVQIHFGITTLMILYPRIEKDIEIAKEKKKNKNKQTEEEKKNKKIEMQGFHDVDEFYRE